LTDYLRVGFALSKIPQQEIHGIDEEYEYASGTSYNFLVEYVINPAAPLFLSRAEIAIAAGLSYNSLCVDGTLSSHSGSWLFGPTFLEKEVTFSVKKNVLGLYVRVSYDYYFSKYLSLQLKSGGMIVPSIDVPRISHSNPNNNEVKTLKQHAVNFSGVDFSFGLRIHL
jgi:hypothetical protein